MKKSANVLKDRKQMNSNTMLLLITIALFIILYAAGCVAYASKGFTNLQTFLNLFRTNAGLICVACGLTCVMLTGGIDISVGSLVALDCMLLAYGMSEWNMSAPVMVLLVLVIGVVLGVAGLLVQVMSVSGMGNALVDGADLVAAASAPMWIGVVCMVVAAAAAFMALRNSKSTALAAAAPVLAIVGVFAARLAFYAVQLSVGLYVG